MLDLKRLQKIRLVTYPRGQIFYASTVLAPNYNLFPKTNIRIENIERIPQERTCFLALNHTDRYNSWPIQYVMHRMKLRYTAVWVKGKYYENNWIGGFLDAMNSIPMPSRGHLIVTRFRDVMGRTPSGEEYRVLRDLANEEATPEDAARTPGVQDYLEGEQCEAYGPWIEELFLRYANEATRIHRDGADTNAIHFLVFPQGTRSKHLLRGRTGMMHMAQKLGLDIVPIGCNGSDLCYPGNSPLSKGGEIVYRVGEPLRLDGPELGAHRITEDYVPLSHEANRLYGERFQAATDVVMEHINELLDPEYRFQSDPSDESDGSGRFV